LGQIKARIYELLAENQSMPRKQRYTAHKIFEQLQSGGYAGSESHVRGYVVQQRQVSRRPEAYLPLEFDPGKDAQADWGEAEVTSLLTAVAGEQVTAQLFVCAYPTQSRSPSSVGTCAPSRTWAVVRSG
jgi:hypothetical protein